MFMKRHLKALKGCSRFFKTEILIHVSIKELESCTIFVEGCKFEKTNPVKVFLLSGRLINILV